MKKENKDIIGSPESGEREEKIITVLAPKRLPSVAPGLEGVAAMAAVAEDSFDGLDEGSPHDISYPTEDFVEPQVASCGVGGNAWGDLGIPQTIDFVDQGDNLEDNTDYVELINEKEDISSEDGGSSVLIGGDEHDHGQEIIDYSDPDSFLVGVFDGQEEFDQDQGQDQNQDLYLDGSNALNIDDYLQICVLPDFSEFELHKPEDIDSGDYVGDDFESGGVEDTSQDVDYSKELLTEYDLYLEKNSFLDDHLEGGEFVSQVITPSAYFPKLEFENPEKASSFDKWYEQTYLVSFERDSSIYELTGTNPEPVYSLSKDIIYTPESQNPDVYSNTAIDGEETFVRNLAGGQEDKGNLDIVVEDVVVGDVVVEPKGLSPKVGFYHSQDVHNNIVLPDLSPNLQVSDINMSEQAYVDLPLEININEVGVYNGLQGESASNEVIDPSDPSVNVDSELLVLNGSNFELSYLPILAGGKGLEAQVSLENEVFHKDGEETPVSEQLEEFKGHSLGFTPHHIAAAGLAMAVAPSPKTKKAQS